MTLTATLKVACSSLGEFDHSRKELSARPSPGKLLASPSKPQGIEECADAYVAVEPALTRRGGNHSVFDSDLSAALDDVMGEIQDWGSSRLAPVSLLQEARGNCGFVFLMKPLGKALHEGVAVKVMPNDWLTQSVDQFDEVYPGARERPWKDVGLVRLLNESNFRYVCRSMGMFRDDKATYVVSSLANEGDLFSWCNAGPPPGPQREAIVRPLMVQIFDAVKHLHDIGIVHRDLSLENILLHNEFGSSNIKLIDFAMAALSRECVGEGGKDMYQAPEMHTNEPHDGYLADDFSLGVVLYAMAFSDYPWRVTKPKECQLCNFFVERGLRAFVRKRTLRNGDGESIGSVASPHLVDLMEALLDFDPETRPCVGEADIRLCGSGRRSVSDFAWPYGR